MCAVWQRLLSRRSIFATATFFAVALATVYVTRHRRRIGRAMRTLVVFLIGALFGTGLAISGMMNPAKVISFLDARAIGTRPSRS